MDLNLDHYICSSTSPPPFAKCRFVSDRGTIPASQLRVRISSKHRHRRQTQDSNCRISLPVSSGFASSCATLAPLDSTSSSTLLPAFGYLAHKLSRVHHSFQLLFRPDSLLEPHTLLLHASSTATWSKRARTLLTHSLRATKALPLPSLSHLVHLFSHKSSTPSPSDPPLVIFTHNNPPRTHQHDDFRVPTLRPQAA